MSELKRVVEKAQINIPKKKKQKAKIRIGHNIPNLRTKELAPVPKEEDLTAKQLSVKRRGVSIRNKEVEAGQSRYRFRSGKLNDLYENFVNDAERLDLRDELALARTVLASTIEKIRTKNDKLSASAQITIITLAKQVGEIAEQMARIQKANHEMVSLEHIRLVTDQLSAIVAKHLPLEAMEDVLREFDKIDIPLGGVQRVKRINGITE